MLAFNFPEFHTEWGFWFFLLQGVAVALTALIPPLPAEFMVITSGAMAAEGVFLLFGAFIATFLGCLIGDIGLYALFRYKFIRVLYRWRWGRQLHRKILRISVRAGGSHTWFGLLLIIAMPFGRSAAFATAGMIRLDWGRLLGLAVTGGFLWTWWLLGLGYLPALVTDLPTWLSTVIGISAGSLAGAAVAYIGTRGRPLRTKRVQEPITALHSSNLILTKEKIND
ncbi:DedA family protein [Nesterenkonia ebinurensis]|uniref:DedA family protein n=1 Tax=Nesterenkonia ebinurensis TaxID=2608252 RepID=UPI00123E0923|nr:VTT domain-containing protein [Nesterenkonia ebinurensis]